MELGIDFGTCFSSIAIMNGTRPMTNLFDDDRGAGIPTLFMYSRKYQQEVYGFECTKSDAIQNSEDVVRYMKKMVRENPNNLDKIVMSGGKKYTIRDILKRYLNYLIAQAKVAASEIDDIKNPNIESVTITVPVGISSGQMPTTDYRSLLQNEIIEITGLSKYNVHILEEPSAAAMSYLYKRCVIQRYDKKQTILVFDLGGGTLDVSIVEYDSATGTYGVKAKEGDLNLGGNDWDNALVDAALRKLGIREFSSAVERIDFQLRINALKHSLTDSDCATMPITYNGDVKPLLFTRKEFEEITKGLLDRAISLTKKAINSYSSRGVSALDKIVLVGGGSNMPQVYNRMMSEFPQLGESGIVVYEPSKAIAKGAAIYSKLKPTPDPTPGGFDDIATCTYGFNCTRSRDGKRMIYNLLFKGTHFGSDGKIIVKETDSFCAVKDSQTEVNWTVYESNAEKGFGEDANWMDYGSNEHKNGMEVIIKIPPEYIGKARLYKHWVTFCLDKNGILEIIITDKDGRQIGYDKKQV